MHNVKFHSERATEDQIIDAVFDACRANESRATTTVRGGYTVKFNNGDLPAGEHLALVYNADDQLCGSAVVDASDC